MDNYEATKTILAKIQSMDPDNASKIMGYILIQDLGDKEMIRLALGPDSLLVTLMNQAKTCLGLGGLGLSPNNHNHSNRHNPFSQTTPRILIPNNNGFHPQNHHFPSSPSPTSPWSSNAAAFSMNSPRPASYASVVNGGPTNGGNGASGSSSSSLSLPFYGLNTNNNTINNNNNSSELNDEFVGNLQFLDDSLENQHQHHHHPLMSPSGRSDSMIFPYGNSEDPSQHPQLHHRRSFSVNDVFLGGGNGVEDGGVGGGGNGFAWRPCMYYARGFCKNGSSCKFLHGGIDSPDGGVSVGGGSPTKISDGGYDDFLRMKAIQQQRLVAAASLMASNAGQHPFPYNNNKALTFLNENQRSAAAAMMMSEEFHKFNRFRPDRMNFSGMGLDGPANSTSRQIYLTFPADSTFKEEDVSNYFGMYGPVQDVRIPYQQKRMFGFVTFVYPETVKLILAKGNPHFVCDSRVLVKPYKEKGKVVEKKHHQQQQLVDQGEFPGCLSPTAFDSQESYDLPFGAGMFFNTQEMMLRRKFEERAELQQAIDLQGRRLMNMQMMELQQNHNHAQFMPTLSPPIPHHNLMFLPQEGINVELQEGINTSQEVVVNSPKETQEATESPKKEDDATNNLKDSEFNESLEHNLPDNLFASPTKSSENRSLFAEAFNNETADNNSNNNKSVSPLQTCNFQSPRFSSSQEAIKM